MRKFTTAVVVRLAAAALLGTALSAAGAQVAQASDSHGSGVTAATMPAITTVTDADGNVVAVPDTWPWS
jgi:hypothetical protein